MFFINPQKHLLSAERLMFILLINFFLDLGQKESH